jgi:sugar phosphate isomerase/epimerase
MTPIRTAFSTLGCPDWSWRDILEHGPRYGYDGVEIRLVARQLDLLSLPEFRPAERETRRRELADAGFQICGLASSVRFDDPDERARREQVEIGRVHLELARDLGASFVRVFGDVLPPGADGTARRTAVERIAEGLQRLGEAGEQAGVDVLIETHGDFADSRLTHETLSLVESPAVGVVWDTHHPWRFFGEDLTETFARLRPWVRHTHWKDSVSRPRRPTDETSEAAAAQAHALMSGHRHADYALFGEGEFPAAECMRLLREAGYDGWFSLEWEKMWHPEIEAPEVALPPFPEAIRRLW